MTTISVPFFNPRDASPDILFGMLVGRDDIVSEILEDLRRQIHSKTRQHWLIRGPRGIGKTHLMGIIYHSIKMNQELSSNYIPIWLSETDAYGAYSAGILLLEIARRLEEELEILRDPDTRRLSSELRGVTLQGDDPILFEETCELLKEEAKKRKKLFLIIMENLDAFLSGLSPKANRTEIQRFRSLLLHDHEFLFISTTPTQYLAGLSDPKEPLYGHLKERQLRPLKEEEVEGLFANLCRLTEKPEQEKILNGSREALVRRRVIHRLTGGVARSVVMAFAITGGASDVETMVQEFRTLLDQQTSYFEARLARLAPRERTIVAAMALAVENPTLQEIARITRLPERSLSTQTDRLILEGHLVRSSGDGGKGSIYSLVDGLFRLWYQYRKGRVLLEPIVRFLALWHQESDLQDTLVELRTRAECETLPAVVREAAKKALIHVQEAYRYRTSETGKKEREELWKSCQEIEIPLEPIVLLKNAFDLILKDKASDSMQEFRLFLARFGESKEPALQKLVAFAMVYMGVALGQLWRHEEALQAYRNFLSRFGESKEPAVQELVAVAMVVLGGALSRLGRYEEAETQVSDWITRIAHSTVLPPELDIDFVLRYFLSNFPLQTVRRWFATLMESDSTIAETARLYHFVLQVLEAGESVSGKARGKGPAARVRKSLARVPPELRLTVEEMAENIKAERAREENTRGRALNPAGSTAENNTAEPRDC